ncbi:MAG: hypothetical protein ACREAC_22970, partial [Blastocatellia bacterium]
EPRGARQQDRRPSIINDSRKEMRRTDVIESNETHFVLKVWCEIEAGEAKKVRHCYECEN